MNAVTELAGKLKKFSKRGSDRFIFADLKKFLPTCCPEFRAVEDDFEEEGDRQSVKDSLVKLLECKGDSARDKKKTDYKLQLAYWMAAWDSYALAAAVLGQMKFETAIRHKRNCLEIAANAPAGKRRQLLGVIYDELARKEWEDKSAKLGSRFDINMVAGVVCGDILRRAKDEHDRMFGAGERNAPHHNSNRTYPNSNRSGSSYDYGYSKGQYGGAKRPAQSGGTSQEQARAECGKETEVHGQHQVFQVWRVGAFSNKMPCVEKRGGHKEMSNACVATGTDKRFNNLSANSVKVTAASSCAQAAPEKACTVLCFSFSFLMTSVGMLPVEAPTNQAADTQPYAWEGDRLRLWCGDGTWVLLPATPGLRDH
eukprot:12409470-Karenia_brevis.AAC.1